MYILVDFLPSSMGTTRVVGSQGPGSPFKPVDQCGSTANDPFITHTRSGSGMDYLNCVYAKQCG